MNRTSIGFTLAAALWCGGAALSGAQQAVVAVDDDDITIRGCVGRPGPGGPAAQQMLVWTRGDLMLSNASRLGAASGVPERVFYWLEDDEDLSKHVGQLIEVKGELDDFEKGEFEVTRDGEFTEIELELGGKSEKARIPTTWLGSPKAEGEFEFVARRIDVDEVSVLGPCAAR